MSNLLVDLVMMKPIICQCFLRECIHAVFICSVYLNIVFAMANSNSEQMFSRSSPFELHLPIPCFPMTVDYLLKTELILALKFPISDSVFCPWNRAECGSQLIIKL